MTAVELHSLTLTYGLSSNGEPDLGFAFGENSDPAENLVTLLGMLRMAEDTLIRVARGEIDEDYDDDEED